MTLKSLISTLPFLIPYHILLASQSKKLGCKLSIAHIVTVYIFVYYITCVFFFTGIPSIRDLLTQTELHISPEKINLLPFRWLSEGVRPYIENMALFIPLGLMLPSIWNRKEALWRTALFGFVFSFLIELSQMLSGRVTDIDDLLMNTLGAVLGWLLFRLLKAPLTKIRGKVAVQSATPEKIPLLLRAESCFYIAIAFAGMFLVFYPFLGLRILYN